MMWIIAKKNALKNEIATYYCRDEDEGNIHTQKPLKICS